MDETTVQPSGAPEGAPALSAQEQAAVEVGQRGFSEPQNVNAPPPSGPQRPEWLPEKFWNAEKGEANYEALAKSYGELERLRSQPKQEQPRGAKGGVPAPVKSGGKIDKAKEQAEQAPQENPLTPLMEKARAEYAESQAVSEETVEALAQAGVPKEIFATYLRGLELITQQAMSQIYSYVEGEENYSAMARWAAENLSDAELDAYNSALDNPDLRENAVRGLFARYSSARPSEGRLITSIGTPSNAGDLYTDRAQLIADQRDPRYQSDAAFRQSVVDKLARSQRAGFRLTARPMFEREIISR